MYDATSIEVGGRRVGPRDELEKGDAFAFSNMTLELMLV